VTLAAVEPLTLDTTILSTLKTKPLEAALDKRVVALVVLKATYVVLPVIVETLTILGFATFILLK
jgi:hypothetical protein